MLTAPHQFLFEKIHLVMTTSLPKIIIVLCVFWKAFLTERCRYVLQNKQGFIKSPNHPQDYPNNIACTWLIEAQDGYNILLEVESFRLQGTTPDCKHDALQIYDGRNETATSFQSPYCEEKIPRNLRSTGPFLFLKFTTDSQRTFSGFNIKYKSEQNCNDTVNADNGTILSPRFPMEYYSNADCYWTITTRVGTVIDVTFQSFQLEGSGDGIDQCYDFLAFYEIIDEKMNQLGIFCGSKSPGEIKSQTNKMRIHFFSDGTVVSKGFHLTFSAQYPKSQTTTLSPAGKRIKAKPIVGGCIGSQFMCNNSNCIPLEQRCNQQDDCGDQSDEINCAGPCSIRNGGCEHRCNIHPLWGDFCSCEAGYELTSNKRSCQDINECANKNGGCAEKCSNFVGGYKCECSSGGYQIGPDGKTCQDINECHASPCEYRCENTVGSYYCTCKSGFRPTSSGRCVDQDECAIGVPSCFDCINTIGSYRCNCFQGFSPVNNASKCEDIDECVEHTHQCDQICVNTFGSYSCLCKDGYKKQDKKCIDINECQDQGLECEHLCENMPGSYRCTCLKNFMLINRTKCIDMSECKTRHLCKYGCTIINSRIVCTCPSGYTLSSNGKDCHQEVQIKDCGASQSAPTSRKLGFSKTAGRKWPWEASLEMIVPPFKLRLHMAGCMATLISRVYLLATAHCLYFDGNKLLPAHLEVTLADTEVTSTMFEVQEIYIHPDYYKRNMQRNADIALIKLAKPIPSSYFAQPICVNPKMELEVDENGLLITKGRLDEERFLSKLQEVQVKKQNRTHCEWLRELDYDLSKMICVGDFSSTKPCLADSGTPFMVQILDKWFLAGMMVHGAGLPNKQPCSIEYKSNAFYNLSYFQQWISNHMPGFL